jgi:hypothetical protein
MYKVSQQLNRVLLLQDFSSLMFLLGSHIHVYYSIYVVNMLMLDSWYVCSVCFPYVLL